MLWLSLRPFLIVSILWGCLIWLTWTPALAVLSEFLTNSLFTNWIQEGLIWAGFENARAWIAPLFFVMLIIPLITISLLVFIAFTTVPTIVKIVVRQAHYQDLECEPDLYLVVGTDLPCIGHADIASVVGPAIGSSVAAIALGMVNDASDVL
jgi:hypothetical protein